MSWALAFQTLLCIQKTTNDDNCLLTAEHLFVAKDGSVLEISLTFGQTNTSSLFSKLILFCLLF